MSVGVEKVKGIGPFLAFGEGEDLIQNDEELTALFYVNKKYIECNYVQMYFD